MKNINRRIVHFDLKGAPWKVLYLKEVLLLVKQWGATGILFEWEDSFPYTGSLINVGSLGGSNRDGLYSEEEIKHLLQFTAELGLEPIQLVQSLGHLEFVLKHEEFVHLREVRYYPSVLCPTRRDGRELVITMAKQALALQPDAKYIHIGADEAWHLNKCVECNAQTNSFGVDSLFISHITAIVTSIKATYPNVNVLIWDDMMRDIQEESLQAAQMYKFVTPVVWHYSPVNGFSLPVQMWLKYEKCFPEVWVASAYKGASTSCEIIPPVELYTSNQQAWIEQVKVLEGRCLQVTSIVLTGWSRYDHYATLCELLPVALHSLTSCLKMWVQPNDWPASQAVSRESVTARLGAGCARNVRELAECRARAYAFLHGAHVQTWLNPWQLAHNFTNPLQLIPIGHSAKQLVHELNIIRSDIFIHLNGLTGPRSSQEWIQTNIDPVISDLQRIVQEASDRAQLPPSVSPTASDPSDAAS